MAISLKHVAMQLCTCTWIEIMTGAGITLYLLSMQNYTLAAVTVAAFGPLIGFHFAIDRIKPGRDGGGWKKDEKEKKEKENNGRTIVVKIRSLAGCCSGRTGMRLSEHQLVD
ncbi:hypothetical protein [Nitrososphaera sp.]|uniref:hypothetical protein n=1 Tax=Nitrososphaera sp. TaxID=1971748 RepID=UPI00307F130D